MIPNSDSYFFRQSFLDKAKKHYLEMALQKLTIFGVVFIDNLLRREQTLSATAARDFFCFYIEHSGEKLNFSDIFELNPDDLH